MIHGTCNSAGVHTPPERRYAIFAQRNLSRLILSLIVLLCLVCTYEILGRVARDTGRDRPAPKYRKPRYKYAIERRSSDPTLSSLFRSTEESSLKRICLPKFRITSLRGTRSRIRLTRRTILHVNRGFNDFLIPPAAFLSAAIRGNRIFLFRRMPAASEDFGKPNAAN